MPITATNLRSLLIAKSCRIIVANAGVPAYHIGP